MFVLFNIVSPVLSKVPGMYDLCNQCLLKDFFSEVLLPSPLLLRSKLIPDSSIPHLCFSSNTIVTSLARAFIISHLNYYNSLFVGGPPLTYSTYYCQSDISQMQFWSLSPFPYTFLLVPCPWLNMTPSSVSRPELNGPVRTVNYLNCQMFCVCVFFWRKNVEILKRFHDLKSNNCFIRQNSLF